MATGPAPSGATGCRRAGVLERAREPEYLARSPPRHLAACPAPSQIRERPGRHRGAFAFGRKFSGSSRHHLPTGFPDDGRPGRGRGRASVLRPPAPPGPTTGGAPRAPGRHPRGEPAGRCTVRPASRDLNTEAEGKAGLGYLVSGGPRPLGATGPAGGRPHRARPRAPPQGGPEGDAGCARRGPGRARLVPPYRRMGPGPPQARRRKWRGPASRSAPAPVPSRHVRGSTPKARREHERVTFAGRPADRHLGDVSRRAPRPSSARWLPKGVP